MAALYRPLPFGFKSIVGAAFLAALAKLGMASLCAAMFAEISLYAEMTFFNRPPMEIYMEVASGPFP